MTGNVGIVIVSHSIDVAKGAADMVRQMVGEEVRVAFCGVVGIVEAVRIGPHRDAGLRPERQINDWQSHQQ